MIKDLCVRLIIVSSLSYDHNLKTYPRCVTVIFSMVLHFPSGYTTHSSSFQVSSIVYPLSIARLPKIVYIAFEDIYNSQVILRG